MDLDALAFDCCHRSSVSRSLAWVYLVCRDPAFRTQVCQTQAYRSLGADRLELIDPLDRVCSALWVALASEQARGLAGCVQVCDHLLRELVYGLHAVLAWKPLFESAQILGVEQK